MALRASFVRHRDHRDRVYVTRGDGRSTGWEFPTYGDRLPHDLCHLVVEDGLGIAGGFWGLIDQGAEMKLIDNQATLVRAGRPLVQQVGTDFSDLIRAEQAVALLSPTGIRTDEHRGFAVVHLDAATNGTTTDNLTAHLGFALPAGASPEAVASLRERLHSLGAQWRELEDGGCISLTYPGSTCDAGRRASDRLRRAFWDTRC